MADITKCYYKECPKLEVCWRQEAPDDFWQSYAYFDWSVDEKGEFLCNGFWSMGGDNAKNSSES